jgi:hypothetical protein
MSKSARRSINKRQVPKPVFSPKVNLALATLLESCPPSRLSRHLRVVLLDYISSYKDTLPLDFEVYLYDFSCLFDFLDAIEKEHTRQIKKPSI